MKIDFDGNLEDFNMLMISALRYGMGNREYIASWISNIIQKNIKLLNEKNIKVMIRNIKEQARFGFGDCNCYSPWIKLLDLLEEEKRKYED